MQAHVANSSTYPFWVLRRIAVQNPTSDRTKITISFDWLVQGFKQQQKYKDVDAHTKRTYDNGTQLFADHILKDGSRAGSKQVGDFTKAFVDAVYAKLLVVESLDAEGNVVHRERRRTRSGPGSSLFPAPKNASPSEQNQPVCRNSRR